jgi:hypothetical protein
LAQRSPSYFDVGRGRVDPSPARLKNNRAKSADLGGSCVWLHTKSVH